LKESKSALDKLGEQIIRQKAIDVAAQIDIFLRSHPKMKKEEAVKDPWLKEIAVQRSGRPVIRPSTITGASITSMSIHKSSGPTFMTWPKAPAFWKSGGEPVRTGGGLLRLERCGWRDPAEVYVFGPCQNSDLIVASTTYIEEFSKPTKAMEAKMEVIKRRFLQGYEEKFEIFYVIIGVVLVILLIVIFFYSRSVIQPIRYLSDVADRISMGELDAPIDLKAKGEVGILLNPSGGCKPA